KVLAAHTGIKAKVFDCCISSCVAFTGDLKDLEVCPCGEARKYQHTETKVSAPVPPGTFAMADGRQDIPRQQRSSAELKPRSTFVYIPVIPRLAMQWASRERAQTMKTYVSTILRTRFPGVRDFWDGHIYNKLRRTGRCFQDVRDMAFLLCTDGVQLVKIKTHGVWPILLINLNLPPDQRYKQENMILVGIIPGPNEPTEIDTFLLPL
ncbi:hypothetical protein SAICODRAFT_45375, partial [Saitoella complicata NRRL Y-17804]